MDRQAETVTETETETETGTETETDRQTDRRTDGQTDRQRQTDRDRQRQRQAKRAARHSTHPTAPAERDRLWKLLSFSDALLLNTVSKIRGGKRGQGQQTLNQLLTSRLRTWWAGGWSQLFADLESNQMGGTARPSKESQLARDKREVNIIKDLVSHKATSKATSRINEPLRFAQGSDIPQRFQALFPPAPPAIPPQALSDDITTELRTELVTHIQSALNTLPTMSGAGSNGAYFEHLRLHSAIQNGTSELADVLADLLTGTAPSEAVKCLRSGRCHPPLKPDSDTDIRPLVSASAQWRAAMRGWNAMFSEETKEAVGQSQYGARPGGPAALRHYIEASLAQDPALALAALDIANMYGSMSISNIEEQVRHRIPRMWPLLAPWVRLPRCHMYKDSNGVLHNIHATTGVDQGCPGSSSLGCLGITSLHESLSEFSTVAGLQDDTYLLINQDRIKDALEAIAPSLAPTGCTLKLRKCSVFSPGHCDTGTSGIQRVDALPHVLKQALDSS